MWRAFPLPSRLIVGRPTLIQVSARSRIPSFRGQTVARLGAIPDRHMSPRTPTASPIKRCPVCGVAMLGTRKTAISRDFDYFECFNCDLS
jgi:hypothetical protein